MINKEDLERAINIQRKSYKLLLWVTEEIDNERMTFSRDHGDISAAEAAFDWINLLYPYLSSSIRPDKESLREFSNYFGSYVTTSFDLVDDPGQRLYTSTGCLCNLCLRLIDLPHLKTKKPTTNDKYLAEQMRVDRVMTLAKEEGMDISREIAKQIATSREYLRIAAYSAYAQCLLERINGSEGGVYILVLWRQIAWKPEGSPIPGFKLEAQDVIDAEQRLLEEINRNL